LLQMHLRHIFEVSLRASSRFGGGNRISKVSGTYQVRMSGIHALVEGCRSLQFIALREVLK
jgi:hypothetical protein